MSSISWNLRNSSRYAGHTEQQIVTLAEQKDRNYHGNRSWGGGVVSVPVSNNLLTLVFSISEVKPALTIASRQLNFEWGFHCISTKDEILLPLKALE
jgi:hypothetical protein